MKTINLTQGQVSIVDDEDYERLNNLKWSAAYSKSMNCFYAVHRRYNKIKKAPETIRMHRFIMGLNIGDIREVDHINKNTLDNRKQNLKITDRKGNMNNRKDQSKYGVGISLSKILKTNPYVVSLWYNKKYNYIGIYPTLELAETAKKKWIENKEVIK